MPCSYDVALRPPKLVGGTSALRHRRPSKPQAMPNIGKKPTHPEGGRGEEQGGPKMCFRKVAQRAKIIVSPTWGAKLGRNRPRLVEQSPNSTVSEPNVDDVGIHSPMLVEFWPISVDIGPTSVDSEPTLAPMRGPRGKRCRNRAPCNGPAPQSGLCVSEGSDRPIFDRCRAKCGRSQPNLPEALSMSGHVRSQLGRFRARGRALNKLPNV